MKYLTMAILLLMQMNQVLAANFYDIKEIDIDGNEIKMDKFKGKVLLIVNIASQCGFTGQLEDLQIIQDQYKDKNFTIIGVPTNDFGGQTPEDDKGMKEFCQKKYKVNFPLLQKATIIGKDKRQLYKFLTEDAGNKVKGDVGWNFVKFLVDKEGNVVDRFTSLTNPSSGSVKKAIEKLL